MPDVGTWDGLASQTGYFESVATVHMLAFVYLFVYFVVCAGRIGCLFSCVPGNWV